MRSPVFHFKDFNERLPEVKAIQTKTSFFRFASLRESLDISLKVLNKGLVFLAGGLPGGLLQHRLLDDGSASGRRTVLPLPVSGGPYVSGGSESGSAHRRRLHLPAGRFSALLSDAFPWRPCSGVLIYCRWRRLWDPSRRSRSCCSPGSSSALTPSPGTCSGCPTSPTSGGGAVDRKTKITFCQYLIK